MIRHHFKIPENSLQTFSIDFYENAPELNKYKVTKNMKTPKFFDMY